MNTVWMIYGSSIFTTLTELWHLLCSNLPLSELRGNGQPSSEASRLLLMLQFIHDHYAESLSLQDIASAANVGKSSTLACFQKGIGQSPISYLIEYRLIQAANLLKTTKKPLSIISIETGFSSVSYFCRKFKQYYATTPEQYRNRS